MNHEYCYRLRFSECSLRNKSGLDYSKMVIIKNMTYLDDSEPAIIDQDEFK